MTDLPLKNRRAHGIHREDANIVLDGVMNERWKETHPPIPTKNRLTNLFGSLFNSKVDSKEMMMMKKEKEEIFYFSVETQPK